MSDHIHDTIYSVAVIGAGPAGVSVCCELAKLGVGVVLFGPQRHDIPVENIVPANFDPDHALFFALNRQLDDCLKQGDVTRVYRKVTKLIPGNAHDDPFKITDDENKVWCAKRVVVASGSTMRSLIAESESMNKHVAECLFASVGTQVHAIPKATLTAVDHFVVIGPAIPHTLLHTLELLRRRSVADAVKSKNSIAPSVTIVTKGSFDSTAKLYKYCKEAKSITILENHMIAAMDVSEEKVQVKSLTVAPVTSTVEELRAGTAGVEIPCQYALTLLGGTGNTSFLKGLGVCMDNSQRVIIDIDAGYTSSLSQLFAIGSVTKSTICVTGATYEGRVLATVLATLPSA